jgi:hypothetical protein
MLSWLSGIPGDIFPGLLQREAMASDIKTVFIIVKASIVILEDLFLFDLATSAFSLDPNPQNLLSYVEVAPGKKDDLINYFASKKIPYVDLDNVDKIRSLFVHVTMWVMTNTFEGASFGIVTSIPCMQCPCLIFDISQRGIVKAAAIPIKTCSRAPRAHHWKAPIQTTFQVGFSPNSPSITCTNINDGMVYNGFQIIEAPIEFFSIRAEFEQDHKQKLLDAFQHLYQPSNFFTFCSEPTEEHLALFPLPIVDFSCSGSPVPDVTHSRVRTEIAGERSCTESSREQNDLKMSPKEEEKIEISGKKEQPSDEHLKEEENEEDTREEEEDTREEEEDTGEEEEEVENEEVEEAKKEDSIWPPYHPRIPRFDDDRWPEVRAILLKQVGIGRINWDKLVQQIGGHPKETLRFWYYQLKKDPTWEPSRVRCGQKNRVLQPGLTEQIWNRINTEYLQKHYLFTDEHCREIALEEVEKFNKSASPKSRIQFRASRNWVRKFREEHEVSLRTPHLRRRQKPDIKSIQVFSNELDQAMENMDHRHIVNADETNWPVVSSRTKTWINYNGEKSINRDVRAVVDGDNKASFTVMATITASGESLPLFMLAKGKTERCEKQLTAIDGNIISHSENGWVTLEVMEEYLYFLRSTMEQKFGLKTRQKLLLILDVYASHRKGHLIEKARQLNIDLLFIPAGMTGELQPLDATIFGELKSAGAGKFLKAYMVKPNQTFTKQKASISIQKCWENLKPTSILKSWEVVISNARKFSEN